MFLSIISVVLMFSVIILVHEAGHFFFAKKVGIKVERFSLGFGPKLFAWKKGDTVYQLCLLPFGGFVKMAGDDYGTKETFESWEYMGKSSGHRAQVVVAGSMNNLILGILLLIPVFIIGVPGYDGTRIGSFAEGMPAEESGLQVGDEVLEVNGRNVREWFDVLLSIRQAIEADKDSEVVLTVRRNGEILSVGVQPAPAPVEPGAVISSETGYFIGIAPSEKIEKFNFAGAVVRAGQEFYKMIYGIFMAIRLLFTRQVSARHLAGPIGIAQWGAEIVHYGFGRFLYFTAFISVNLGIINLMPFPVLDGGHLFGLFVERVTGVKPGRKMLEMVQYVGIVCILLLAVYVTYNDLLRVLENIVRGQ